MTGEKFFFVQISDLQFGMFRPGAADYDETPLVEQAVARINDLRPAFVLCNGDLIDEPCSEVQFAEAQRLLGGIHVSIPFHTVPGNHDVGDAPTANELAWFRDRVGPDRFSFDHGGRHLVGINSCLLADGTHAPEEALAQWSWLDDDLGSNAANGGAPVILFMHHPPFLDGSDEPDGYFNLPRETRGPFLDLLHRHSVRIVLTGHLHRNNLTEDSGLAIVTTGPVGMPLQDGVSGLRIVKVDGFELESHYFSLDDVQGQRQYADLS